MTNYNILPYHDNSKVNVRAVAPLDTGKSIMQLIIAITEGY